MTRPTDSKRQSNVPATNPNTERTAATGTDAEGTAVERSKQTPWYQDGLAFECTQCGGCCSGEPGFVFVDADEIAELAAFMQLDVAKFERGFIRRVGQKKSLVEYSNGDCVFLDSETRKCTVYEARPIQCRTWPFWTSNLRSQQAWKMTCDACPGAGKGQLYSFDEIEVRRKQKSV